MICGLVLAAGAGTRYRPEGALSGAQSKLLAVLDGRPLLDHAVDAQSALRELSRVVVVLGAFSEEVLGSVHFGRAETIVCSEWARGQSASLRCGLRALDGASKVIVTLGDEPRISSEVIRRFLDQPPGARAVYEGRPGHPVVLGRGQIRALAGVTGDRGARDILGGGPEVECSDLWSGRDVDTFRDLEEIRDEARAVL